MSSVTKAGIEDGGRIASLDAFAPGAIVAEKYKVERQLAEGGLGIVVVATQVELGRAVAIKYLKPSVLARPELVERFKREAQLAASIRSDHVVRIYDVGTHPTAGAYMVMEYLEGEDLGDRVQRGPLPVREAVDYIVQACDALAEAHALGIVHRDLKPENLFLARRAGAAPIVKVLDFGISKVTERHSSTIEAPRGRRITEDGARLGTPMYMSPEQLLAERPVDSRTDIWSLGVVLFELVTGVLPFDGESIPHIGANIVGSAPLALRSKLPDASPALEAMIAKCLEKNPDLRYRNVAELVEELVSFEAPASQPRIARIRHVVATGGDSIRPPRPLGMPTPLDEMVPLLLVPGAMQQSSTASPTPMTVTAPSTPPALRSRSRLGVVLVAACAVVAAVAITVLVMRRPIEVAPSSPASSTPPPAALPALPPPSAIEVAAPVAAPASAPSASAAPPPPARPAVAAPPKKSAPDYSDFGDRR